MKNFETQILTDMAIKQRDLKQTLYKTKHEIEQEEKEKEDQKKKEERERKE